MDLQCNIKKVPPGYKEIYCSSGKSDERAFVCDTGYSNGINGPNDTIIIKNKANPTCNFKDLKKKECTSQPFTIPTLLRSGNSENYECTTKESTTNPTDYLDKLRECLKHNRSREYSIKDICEADKKNKCSYEKYKGDYLVTRETYPKTGSRTKPDNTSYQYISNTEAQLLYPNNLTSKDPINRFCYLDSGKPSLTNTNINEVKTNPSITVGSQKDECITLEHYDYKKIPNKLNEIERGQNIHPKKDGAYMGYTLINKDNHFVGTTSEGLLHKISKKDDPNNYYPGKQVIPIPNNNTLDQFSVECNQKSFFHTKKNSYMSIPQSKTPQLIQLGGCEMNMCKKDNTSPFETIYSYYKANKANKTNKKDKMCGGDQEMFHDYFDLTKKDQGLGKGQLTNDKITNLHNSLQCNYCGTIDTEKECDKSDKCYWYQSAGEDVSKCKNKCESRQTLGQCEQFYTGDQGVISDTIYNFDGKDHKCQWIPTYFNSDKSIGSTDGKCRDVDSPCFPETQDTTKCTIKISGKNIPIPGTVKKGKHNKNYCFPNVNILKDTYCNYNYINSKEETCIQHDVTNCSDDCIINSTDYKCVSDGKLFVDLQTGKKRYKTDEECSRFNKDPTSVCKQEPGCLAVPSKKICEAKSINDLMNNKDYSQMTTLCKPLKAQIPTGYDVNLVEEEGVDLSSYSEKHNKDPPYVTSKYLCDICTIRDKDIKKRNKNTDPFYDINTINEDDQKFCEKPIDKYDTINPRKPCVWLPGKGVEKGQCISRCKEPFLKNPIQLSKAGMGEAKKRCSQTLQYSKTERRNILFPNIDASTGNDITKDYYKDMYCTWDGFECHNSIPCKDAQRTRCEDLGYDWYEGTALNASEQNKDTDKLSKVYPIKKKGDGKPIIGDRQGICVFPNISKTFIGSSSEYTIRTPYIGNHGIVLLWREYGTDWKKDFSLFRRKFTKDTTTSTKMSDIRSKIKKLQEEFLGEHVLYIPYNIQGSETPPDIKRIINTALQTYQYFTMNGEYPVWAETIFTWATKTDNADLTNYTKLWYHKKGDVKVLKEISGADAEDDYITYFGGYNYYKYKKVVVNSGEVNGDAAKSTDNDVIMCNVIYDLRGIIPMLPVINNKCKLEITEFNINPNNGEVYFQMYSTYDADNRFEFVKFIGPEDTKGSESGNINKTAAANILHVYRRRSNKDISDPLRIPSDISQGYGSLYEPFMQQGYIHYDPSLSYIDLAKASKGAALPQLNGGINFSALKLLLKTINEKGKNNKNVSEKFKYHYAFYDRYTYLKTEIEAAKNNDIPSKLNLKPTDKVLKTPKINPLLRPTFKYDNDIIQFGSGSIEGWKTYLLLSGVIVPNYNTKISSKSFDKITWTDHLFYKLLNRPKPAGQKKLLPNDIRKAALWSMTRNVHPAFGDLIYDPNYIKSSNDPSNQQNNKLYQNYSQFPFINTLELGFVNDNNGVNEYRKHLLDPFENKTKLDDKIGTNEIPIGMIKWFNLLKYTGKNYNKLIRHKDLPNPSPTKGWFKTGENDWNQTLITILNKANGHGKTEAKSGSSYYKDTYVDYIDLAPNNTLSSNNSDTINLRLFYSQTDMKFPPSNFNTYREYYHPGKWLVPKNNKWPTATTGPGQYGKWGDSNVVNKQTGQIVGETNVELQKIKGLTYNMKQLDKIQKFIEQTEGDASTAWPLSPKVIKDCRKINKWLHKHKRVGQGLPGIDYNYNFTTTFKEITTKKVKNPKWVAAYNLCLKMLGPKECRVSVSATSNISEYTMQNLPYMNKSLPGAFPIKLKESITYSDNLLGEWSNGDTKSSNIKTKSVFYKNPNVTYTSITDINNINSMKSTDLPKIKDYWVKNCKTNYFYDEENYEPFKYVSSTKNIPDGFNDLLLLKSNMKFKKDQLDISSNISSSDPQYLPNKDYYLRRSTKSYPKWIKDSKPYSIIPLSKGLKDRKFQSIYKNLQPNNPLIPKGIKAKVDAMDAAVAKAKAQKPVTINTYNKYKRLLAYVPNKEEHTISKVSLDNCSLPVLDLPISSKSIIEGTGNDEDDILNTHRLFENTQSPKTLRYVMPTICQSHQFTILPPIPSTEYMVHKSELNNSTQKYTKNTSLWINVVPGHPIYNKKNINIFTYYAVKLPPLSGKIINNLITLDGRETIPILAIPSQLNLPLRLPLNPPNICKNTKGLCKDRSNDVKLLNISELVKDESNFSCKTALHEALGSECITKTGTSLKSCMNKNSQIKTHCGSKYLTKVDGVIAKYNDMKERIEPWLYHGQEQQPINYGSNIKPKAQELNPYGSKFKNCKPITRSIQGTEVTFTRIDPAKKIEFFKPRFGSQGVNHIFSKKGKDDKNSYGCIRDDIMNVDESFFDLSCNTNTVYPIERNKFVLINRIIQESINKNPKSPKLNISDRTKLVLMDEEELLYEAAQLGLDMNQLNEYTKPRLTSQVKDIYDPKSGPNGSYEMWDDLEKDYLNIQPNPPNKNLPKLGVKEWSFVGCGLDFNNVDNTRSYQTCKDKYPGLCQRNVALCNSSNRIIKEAITKDCPETCKSQFNSLSEFEDKQIGDLSICSERGRCKWSRDQDDANLLPLCDEISARVYGDNDKCKNFKNIKVGSCTKNNNSLNCMREKCYSLEGCEFKAGNPQDICLISNKVRDDMTTEDCNHHMGTWSGKTGEKGSCIIPSYYDSNLNKAQCDAMQGTFIPKRDSTCLFNSHNWTPLEDPCQMPHNVNFNALTKQQKQQYQNKLQKSIDIVAIEPECIGTKKEIEECQKGKKHPGGFKIILKNPITNLLEGDYIHITADNLGDACSPYLVGYSRVLNVINSTSFIIKGPNEAYTLERNLFNPKKYDIGSCVVNEQFRVFTTSKPDSKEVCNQKAKSTGSSCTYIDSEDPQVESNVCKSCSLIKSREECVIDNRTSACGWGEIRDICESIGDIGDCNDMYSEGCKWDHDKQTCSLNQYRKTQGCMKCGDLKYEHTCNSLTNCFWKNKQCQSCGDAYPGSGSSIQQTKDDCNKKTEGKCQWRNEQGAGEFRCRPVDPYPLIYEWIWYNKWLLLSIVAVIYIFIRLPLGAKTIGLEGSMIATIVMFIIRIMILFVIIPGLFIVPGITRADGTEGRKYYIDPPLNPNKPGYLDFLHDGSKKGALWPAVIYDNRWDDRVMDDTFLKPLIDFEIHPEALNWSEYVLWTPIRKWNNFVNSNTGKTTIFFFFLLLAGMIVFYSTSFYNLSKVTTHSKRTYGIIIIAISILLWLEYLESTYQQRKKNEDEKAGKSKYYGRQVASYPPKSLLGILSTVPTQDNSGKPIHVCPVGCRLYTDKVIDNSPKIISNPSTKYPECGDTRSLFSFKGDLDPDAKKIIKKPYDVNDAESLKKWKIYRGDTGVNHICPDKQDYYKWPYDKLCKDKHHQCLAAPTYGVAIPTNLTQPTDPTPTTKQVGKRGDNFKSKLDEMCRSNHSKYDQCEPYSKSKLSFNDKSDKTGITSKINVNCEFKDQDDNWLSCPFPENIVHLDYVKGNQRLPIKGWEYMWDKIAGVTPRRLGKAEKISWQNQERYEIVDQNYKVDHKF